MPTNTPPDKMPLTLAELSKELQEVSKDKAMFEMFSRKPVWSDTVSFKKTMTSSTDKAITATELQQQLIDFSDLAKQYESRWSYPDYRKDKKFMYESYYYDARELRLRGDPVVAYYAHNSPENIPVLDRKGYMIGYITSWCNAHAAIIANLLRGNYHSVELPFSDFGVAHMPTDDINEDYVRSTIALRYDIRPTRSRDGSGEFVLTMMCQGDELPEGFIRSQGFVDMRRR